MKLDPPILEIKSLKACINENEILKDLNLTIHRRALYLRGMSWLHRLSTCS